MRLLARDTFDIKVSTLSREINLLHLEALNKFRVSTAGLIEFPALHRELFPMPEA